MIDPTLPNRVAEEAQARLDVVSERLRLAQNAAKFWQDACDTALKQRDDRLLCVSCNDMITTGTMNATGIELTVEGLRCGICVSYGGPKAEP